MRVLHVDTAREWRGGQVQLLALLQADGDHVLAAPSEAPLTHRARALGVPVYPLIPGVPFGGGVALRRLVARVRPDLVAAHTSRAHGRALLAGAPVVVHRRVDFAPRQLSGPKYQAPRGYVAVSTAVAGVLRGVGVPADRVAVVYDGVGPPTGESFGLDLGAGPLYGAVGALVPHKGHEVLVRAMAGVPGTLVILGEGPLRPSLTALARSLGVDLRLPGWREDARALLPLLQAFVHPSLEEGLGQAVIEALWAGVPVITTDAGGLPEVVGDAGRVVRAGDVHALREALRCPPIPVETARDRAMRLFSVDAMRAETLAAYRRFLG